MRIWVPLLLLAGACATARPAAPGRASAVFEAADVCVPAPARRARPDVVVPPFPSDWGVSTPRTTVHAAPSAGFAFDDAGLAAARRERVVIGRMRNLGHPVGLPGHAAGRTGHPVGLPGHPVGRPAHPFRRPAHAVGLPAQAVALPAQAAGLPGQAAGLPGQAAGLPEQAVGLPGQAVGLPGQAVGLAGHPVRPPGLQPGHNRSPRAASRRDRRTGRALRNHTTQRNLSVSRARTTNRHTG